MTCLVVNLKYSTDKDSCQEKISPEQGRDSCSARGLGFSRRGTVDFSPIGKILLFPRRGKPIPALTGGGMAARMLAGSMQHRRGGRIPGPCRGRQSCRILESGLLHPPQAALRRFPPIFSFWLRQKEKTGRARSKREKPPKTEHTGDSNTGARR